jgi:t-SNARE complex subunit (syntaxin)
MFNVNTKVAYDEVDMEQVKRDTMSFTGAQGRAINENSGGNAGNVKANTLGLALNVGKAIAGTNMQAQLENARNKFQADVTNLNTEAQNQNMRSRVADMNDADSQAHRDAMLNSIGAIGTNLSGIGLQNTRANIASNLGNYDVSGNYKINQLRNQYIEANPGATEEDFQAWLAQNNFI